MEIEIGGTIMSEVSIVLATYNGAEYLEEQLDSIIENTFTDWTLYICDDGSTDRTLDIIETYQSRYPDKIIAHQNSVNMGVTLNFLDGVTRTDGKYIMFCDQDDVWMPHKIERTLEAMKEKEQEIGENQAIAVFTDAKVVDGVMRTLADSFFRHTGLQAQNHDLAHLLIENKLIGCTMMFNRAVANKMRKMPTRARYHDWWIALIAAAFGEIVYVDEPTINYRQHARNVVGGKTYAKYTVERLLSLKEQKLSLVEDERQAFELLNLYQDEMTEEQASIIRDFASLHSMNWFERRVKLFHHGFWKSGLIRNVGVFLLV